MVTTSSSSSPSPSPSSLGECFQPFGDHLQNPYPFYARLRREEPVTWSPSLGAWLVTRYEDVRAVLRDPETFSSANALRPVFRFYPGTLEELRRGFPMVPSTVDSDGRTHRRLREPLTRALTPEKVAALEPFIRERAEALVDGFAADGSAELMNQYAYPLPVEVIAELLGVDPGDRTRVTVQSYQAASLISAELPEPRQREAAAGMVELMHLLMWYADERWRRPRDDLVSQVVTTLVGRPDGEPLSLEVQSELVWHLLGVMVAGHTTTSSLLGTGLLHLLEDRSRWLLLCEQPELIFAAVEEMARFDPAVQSFFRVTTRPATVGGVHLEAGAELLLLYGSANRDEALCEHPEEFDVARQPTRHLAFGMGLHACVGAGLARTELRISLETLTRRLPNLQLDPYQEVRIRPGLNHRGPWALHVTW
jgi:cytochrome P450